jgi:hypothetical protein
MFKNSRVLAVFCGILAVGCGAPEERTAQPHGAKSTSGLSISAAARATLTPSSCGLLDNALARRRMGSALEGKLLVQCGRAPRSPQITPVLPSLRPHFSTPSTPQFGAASRVRALAEAPAGNILVNNPALDTGGSTQSETTVVAVGKVVCAAWNDAGEGFGLNGFAGFGYSLDGGQTFTDGGPFPAGPSGDLSFGDPSLAYSARDSAFYLGSLSSAGLSLWRSVNNCQSFQYVGVIHASGADDKELIAIDNHALSPFFGRIYVGWTDFSGVANANVTSYSDNGGLSWSPEVSLPGSGADGQAMFPAVAPNGDVYMALVNRSFQTGGHQDQWIYSSKDGGNSWSQGADIGTDQLQPEHAPATNDCGRQALNGDIRNLSSPQIVISPDASATAGYVIHAVYPYDSDGSGPDESNVFYRRSSDGAQTWSAEVRLNDDTTTTDQFYPAIGVSETGVLAVSWYDRRLDSPGNLLFDRYLTVSTDGGSSWSPNERISSVSSPVAQTNPNFDGLAVCYHGDYDQVAVSGNVAHVVWSDDRRTTVTGPNPDVYYDQYNVNPHLGLVRAARAGVSCASSVSFTLSDQDLVGTGSHEISLSVSGGDTETLSLTEDPNKLGSFSGSIATAAAIAQANDGVLQVADGATITATYEDADDGSGKPAVSTTTVRVDCSPPILDNVRVSGLSGTSAVVSADSSEPAVISADYGVTCADLKQHAVGMLSGSPAVTLTGLLPGLTYFYAVTASDAFGNSTRADNGGNCFSFKTLDIVYSEDFESGLGGFEIDNGSSTGGTGGTAGFGGAAGSPGKGGAAGSPGKGGAAGSPSKGGSGGADVGEAGATEEGGAPSGGSSGGGGFSNGNGLWHLSQSCVSVVVGHSAKTTLYYGLDSSCTYDNGLPNEGFATSPPITLTDPSFASVEFNYFLGTEGGGFYDQASFELSVNDGPFQVVSSNFTSLVQPDPDEPPSYRIRPGAIGAGRNALLANSGQWQHAVADLTPILQGVGQAQVRLRFHFNTIDGFANDFAGFYVDDVKLLGVLAAAPCSQDADCDDKLFCTGSETCEEGFCAKGVPVVCTADDGVACTDAVCDEATRGCVQRANDALCDDGVFCNGAERCDATAGCQPGTPVTCTGAVSCVSGTCIENLKTCSLVPNNSLCDDGLFCTGFEYCDLKLGCQSSGPPCRDSVTCTDDICNEATQSCSFVPDDTVCNDGLFCDGQEFCDGFQGCRTTGPACGAGLSCDESSDQCIPVCFSDTNLNHQTAGRAFSKKKSFYALGSNDALGKSADVTALQGNGKYWQRVSSCPAPPTIDALTVAVSGSLATVSGTASDPNNDIARIRLTFSVNLSFDVTFDAVGTTSWSGSLSLPYGFHSVTAQAYDRAGLVSAPTFPFYFQVLPPAPPSVDTVAVSVKGRNATVSGTASDSNNDIAFVQIAILQGTTIVASAVAAGTTTYSATFSNLAAGHYSARVQAFDSGGFASLLTFSDAFDVAVTTSCITDTNGNHRSQGRATRRNGKYYALGSNDGLGDKASTITSLNGSDDYWSKVSKCP